MPSYSEIALFVIGIVLSLSMSYYLLFLFDLVKIHPMRPEPLKIDVSNDLGALLPEELRIQKLSAPTSTNDKNTKEVQSNSSTLIQFRKPLPDFDNILKQYHCSPVAYTLALARIDVELRAVVHERREECYSEYKTYRDALRRRRDIALDTAPGSLRRIPFMSYFYYTPATLQDAPSAVFPPCKHCLQSHYADAINPHPQPRILFPSLCDRGPAPQTDWLKSLILFENNIHKLCFHIGVETTKYAPSKECLKTLRSHTSNRRQEVAPLLEENARAAREGIERAGAGLWSAMCAEVHGYARLDVEYVHFDVLTRRIAGVLKPVMGNDGGLSTDSGDVVDWEKELGRYLLL